MFLKNLANCRKERNRAVIRSLCLVGRLWNRLELFHSSGITPFLMEQLKRVVREGAMAVALSFNILAAISSGPDALLVSRVCNSSIISSVEHRSSRGHSSEFICNQSVSELSSGGSDRLKQLEKNWFNIVAFSFSDTATEPFSERVGTDGDEEESLITALQNFLALEDRLVSFSI